MIDIHHHLLFGLDDGSPDLETSVAMVEMAVADGITHIVCTPHANDRYLYSRQENEARAKILREALPASIASRITLGQGCDFHLTYENVEAAKRNSAEFSINGKGYLLIELPDHGIPNNMPELLYDMQIAQLTPILTHPERNATLQRDSKPLAGWIRGGMLVQVTAGSVTGRFGPRATKIAQELLDKRWVHIIASDAHNLTSRPPKMREAYDAIAAKYTEQEAQRLCVTNPLAVFEGRPLAEQPEALHLYEDLEEKSWWQKIFS